MKEQVLTILNRELGRLDDLSQQTGLALDDFRRLDLLIKAHKTLLRELPSIEDPASQDHDPALIPTSELLKDLDAESAD
jgi:hypothetical protein